MIFYLSCTGNTLWAANRLSKSLQESLVPVTDPAATATAYRLKEGEKLGFCFPVHGWRPPKIVRDFIRRLTVENMSGHYSFALCTAGDNIGETMDIFQQDLKQRGIKLNSTFSLIMPESYVGMPFMDVDKPAKEAQKKKMAAELLTQYIEMIDNEEDGIRRLTIGNWPRINSRIIGGYFVRHLVTDKPFRVDEQRCVKCGKCASVCPVANVIGGKDRFPAWKKDGSCLACFACYHHCPTRAIEYGRRTKNKGQYYYKP